MAFFKKKPEPVSQFARPDVEPDWSDFDAEVKAEQSPVTPTSPESPASQPSPEEPEFLDFSPEPLDPEAGKRLMAHLNEHMRGLPQNAIVEEWSNTANENVFPRTCPSAVPEAFFMHPHSGAVAFFERYLFPISLFEDEYNPEVMNFVSRCKNRALVTYVRDSIEQFGEEETIKRIASGFNPDSTVATGLIELIKG